MSRTFRGSHSLFAMTILFFLASAMTAYGLPSPGLQQRAVTDSVSANDFATEAFGPEQTGTGAADGDSLTGTKSTTTSTSTGTDEESTGLSTTSEISTTSDISTSLNTTSSSSTTSLTTTSTTSTSTSTTLDEPTTTSTPTTSSTRRRTSTIPPASTFEPVPATTLVLDPVVTTSISSTHSASASATPLGASSSGNDFWENKSAVGGTFGAVGVVAAGVFGVIVFGLVRKHRSRSQPARETIDWSDKPTSPYHRRAHSPTNSIEDMVSQTPMDAFRQTRDPFQTLNDGALAYHAQPWVNDPDRAPSVYSQNLAGYGTVATYQAPTPPQQYARGQQAYTPSPAASTSDLGDGHLAPPVSYSRSRPSIGSQYSHYTTDSFYGASGSQPAGQAI